MRQIKIESNCFYDKQWNDLKVVDLSDFKSKNVEPKIREFQNFFTNNIDFFELGNNDLSIIIDKNTPLSLVSSSIDNQENKVSIYFDDFDKKDNQSINNFVVDSINVCYEEFFDYEVFDDYNLNSDVVTVAEHKKIEHCLSSKSDCSYVESYSYFVNLKVILMEK